MPSPLKSADTMKLRKVAERGGRLERMSGRAKARVRAPCALAGRLGSGGQESSHSQNPKNSPRLDRKPAGTVSRG